MQKLRPRPSVEIVPLGRNIDFYEDIDYELPCLMAMKEEVRWVVLQGSLSCFAMLVVMGLQGSLLV